MMRTVLDPITMTANNPAVELVLPDSLTSVVPANAVISLQVYESEATVQLVGASNQTKGCTINSVDAGGYNADAGNFDVRGFELYVYAPVATSITFIPVLIPRRE